MAEEKQLPATPKRRGELRRKGIVVRSQDIGTVILVGGGLFGLLLLGPFLAGGLGGLMANCFKQIEQQASVSGLSPVHASWGWLAGLGGLFAALLILGLVAQIAQIGLEIAEDALEPKLGNLNPLSGLKRLFSLRRSVSTLQAFAKLGVIILFASAAARDLIHADVFTRPVSVSELGNFFITCAWEIGWRVLLAALVIAVVDYIYQRWQFERDNRMSLDEIKDEFKQQEGSPEIKRKRRQIMLRRSMRRMLEDMRDSTIVITNPTHYAVALRYKRGITPVPFMTGKGMRLIAKKLREEATRWHVPIIENPPLARGLYKHGNVGEPIPSMYYQAVAAVLAQLFRRGYRPSDAPAGFYNEPNPQTHEGQTEPGQPNDPTGGLLS
jgi:flagellar biosynthesis protein FlhB